MESATRSVETFRTVCSCDCPDACSVLVTIQDRKAVRFRGDPDHPFTRGFLCGKVSRYEEVVHAPERLLHPLRRSGPKGSGSFERTSWDDALRTIADRIEDARGAHGGESLVLYYYGGNMGNVHRFSAEALFNRLGATTLRQNICYYGADAGYQAVVGGGYGLDPEDVVHSDLVVAWGCNVVTTQVHLVPFIDEARRKGAEFWSVDPYRNRTVAASDHWLQVRPGTDTALALGVMHVLERDGLVDRGFIERRTVGWERLRDEVITRYPPGRAAEITGVSAEDIERFAHRLGAARAPVFKVGIGLGRNSHGGAGVRAVCSLAGALGAYEELGGGVLYDSGCEFKPNLAAIKRPDWLEWPTRVLNMTDLGPALTEWRDPPVKFLYVHGSNPAATAPLQESVLEGLLREDLFTVVHERFLTDTARRADIVLPATTFVECSDLYKSYGHLYFQYARRAMEPSGECRDNLEVIQAIGKALGFRDPWFDASVEDLVREVLKTDHPNFRGVDIEHVLRGETMRLALPRGRSGFAERFNTPSGKLEFASEVLERQGLPAVVDYRGDPFDTRPDLYPFRLLTPPAHAFLNASFGPIERARRKEGAEPAVLIHPSDSGGMQTGDEVELSNEHGRVTLKAKVTTDTQPGVLVAEGTWWPFHTKGGRGINALASARLTDLGGGSTFHDNRVALRGAPRE
ncbi:MAG TPA: molybdopterin oxidoreductase family protein [Planctomycetota bacterium]|nr:molybdopterin oxidoreductase family protein [Planctomycetota bacterium]